MKWLRERPERPEELDQVDYKGRFKTGATSAALPGMEEPVVPKKGALFDDEDDEVEEDEEEEEEDAAAPAAPASVPVGRTW